MEEEELELDEELSDEVGPFTMLPGCGTTTPGEPCSVSEGDRAPLELCVLPALELCEEAPEGEVCPLELAPEP